MHHLTFGFWINMKSLFRLEPIHSFSLQVLFHYIIFDYDYKAKIYEKFRFQTLVFEKCSKTRYMLSVNIWIIDGYRERIWIKNIIEKSYTLSEPVLEGTCCLKRSTMKSLPPCQLFKPCIPAMKHLLFDVIGTWTLRFEFSWSLLS